MQDLITSGTILDYIAPIVIGAIIGVIHYFKPKEARVFAAGALAHAVLSNAVLGLITFSLLGFLEATYVVTLALSASIVYFGVDKALDIFDRLRGFKNTNSN